MTNLRVGADTIRPVFRRLAGPYQGEKTNAGYFQAVGTPKQARLLMVSRQILVLIPAVLLLPKFFGLGGVWLALPTSDFLACLITGTCIFFEMRHLKHAQDAGEGASYRGGLPNN